MSQPTSPSFEDRSRMWADVKFERYESHSPGIAAYLNELRALYAHGDAVYAAFRMPVHPVFELYSSRYQFHALGFFEQFWRHPTVKEAFPYEVKDLNFFDQSIFSQSSPFLLGGLLAGTLSWGGAYREFTRGGAEAKRIGDECALELLGGGFDETLVYTCGKAWSTFFQDVAWDSTHVVMDLNKRLIHVLLATDTD